jgi:colanic acid/amylovoran biosynthesis protein
MQRYLAAVAKLTRVLVEEHGVQVTFLSTCQGVPEYWTDDSRVADRVVSLLPGAVRVHVTVDREFHRPERLIGLFAEHDMVVATRMHAGILALCAGVPVLPIAYEFKTVELFQSLGLGEVTQDIEAVTPESLEQAFRHLLAAGPALSAQIRSRVGDLKDLALGAGPVVRNALAA